MLKDYLAYLAPQTRRAIVFKIQCDIEMFRMDPILALGICLHSVYMHGFIALVRIIIEAPSLYIENRGHRFTSLSIESRWFPVKRLDRFDQRSLAMTMALVIVRSCGVRSCIAVMRFYTCVA